MSPPLATHAVLLTSPGRGAVATVLVAGPQACAVLEQLFQPATHRARAAPAPAEIVFGRWQTTGEEVVVGRPAVDRIEIHCHGGSAAVDALLASLAAAGCQVIHAGDWLRQEQPDRFVRDAIEALARARTLRTAAILLDQQAGALRNELSEVVAALRTGDRQQAATGLEALHGRARLGKHLVEPFRIVLVGAVNVGKSTLANALVGYQRSIVCDRAGTTRDVVTATTAVDGWPVELADTAGLRDAVDDAIETQGIRRTHEQVAAADLVLRVCDARESWTSADEVLQRQADALLVRNKCDLVDRASAVHTAGLLISARTGEGLPGLLDHIARRLVPGPPPPGAGVPFMPEHFVAIGQAQSLLAAGRDAAACEAIENLCR